MEREVPLIHERGLTLEERMWLDDLDDNNNVDNAKATFVKRMKNIFRSIAEAYHKEPRFIENGNIFKMLLFPNSDVGLTYDMDMLWNEYVGGETMEWMEYRCEQNIKMI